MANGKKRRSWTDYFDEVRNLVRDGLLNPSAVRGRTGGGLDTIKKVFAYLVKHGAIEPTEDPSGPPYRIRDIEVLDSVPKPTVKRKKRRRRKSTRTSQPSRSRDGASGSRGTGVTPKQKVETLAKLIEVLGEDSQHGRVLRAILDEDILNAGIKGELGRHAAAILDLLRTN